MKKLDDHKTAKDRWMLLMYISVPAAICLGVAGLTISALSSFRTLHERSVDLWVPALIIAALVLMILVAHSLDRVREIDKAIREDRHDQRHQGDN